MYRYLVILCVLSSLQACVVQQQVTPDDPSFAPVMMPSESMEAPANGSLYSKDTGMNLFSDRRASRVGDILTVVLQETTSSSKSSSIGVKKDSDVSVPAGAGMFLGNPLQIGNMNLESELGSARDFSGESEAGQSNNLSGSVAVSVVDIWPNGTLVVRGEKWITLNRGKEFIRVTGLVRPDDVSQSNSVYSNKIANARITYSGTGELADAQTMGWLSRFFNSAYWPL